MSKQHFMPRPKNSSHGASKVANDNLCFSQSWPGPRQAEIRRRRRRWGRWSRQGCCRPFWRPSCKCSRQNSSSETEINKNILFLKLHNGKLVVSLYYKKSSTLGYDGWRLRMLHTSLVPWQSKLIAHERESVDFLVDSCMISCLTKSSLTSATKTEYSW